MTRKFRMKVDSKLEPKAVAGSVVYKCAKYDYGVATDDTRAFGKPHMSMSLDAEGDYPFFTVPLDDVEPIHDN